jgi:hypothetical protein
MLNKFQKLLTDKMDFIIEFIESKEMESIGFLEIRA